MNGNSFPVFSTIGLCLSAQSYRQSSYRSTFFKILNRLLHIHCNKFRYLLSSSSLKNMKLPIFFLLCMVTLSVIETDLYLASLPSIAANFNCTESFAHNSLSIYLFSFAISVLFAGPLSDRFGRKKTFLTGLTIDILGSILIFFTPYSSLFLVGRAFQGIGGCCGSVFSRVISKELFPPKKGLQILTYLYIAISLSIAIAPGLGGFIESIWGWRSNIVFLALFQIIIWIGCYIYIPETYKEQSFSFSHSSIYKSMIGALKLEDFRYFSLLIAIAWSGFFIYISASSFLFIEWFNKTPFEFGVLFALTITGMTFGSLIAGKLFSFFSLKKTFLIGVVLLNIAGLLLFLPLNSCAGFCIYMLIYLMGTGILLSSCQMQITLYPKELISSLFSFFIFFQMLGASLGDFILSLTGSAIKAPYLISICSLFCLILHLLMSRKQIYQQRELRKDFA